MDGRQIHPERRLPKNNPGSPNKAEEPTEPFAFADWTWLNGTPRNERPGMGLEVLHSGNTL